MSKSHPGQSLAFRKKVIRSAQRKNDRRVLKIAKKLMKSQETNTLDPATAKMFGLECDSYSSTNKLLNYNKDVKQGLEPFKIASD